MDHQRSFVSRSTRSEGVAVSFVATTDRIGNIVALVAGRSADGGARVPVPWGVR
ncbi:hypothetical protein ACLI4R_04250 [Natrialbaceae archaeon A-chndr2]